MAVAISLEPRSGENRLEFVSPSMIKNPKLKYPSKAFDLSWRYILAERWADVSKRIRLDVEIQELEDGTYQPVELTRSQEDSCGGVFQLRAGMSRRILVSTKAIQVYSTPKIRH